MDSLYDQGADLPVGDEAQPDNCSVPQGGLPETGASPTQADWHCLLNNREFARKRDYWARRLKWVLKDSSKDEEDYRSDICTRVMEEWQKAKVERRDDCFSLLRCAESVANGINKYFKAKKRTPEKGFLSIFGGPDGRLIDIPDRSDVPDEMRAFVLDEATKRFSGKKLEIVLLLRKDLTCREIQNQLEERWNPGTQGRSDPDFKKCSLGTISKVRKDFIAIAREIYVGVRFS